MYQYDVQPFPIKYGYNKHEAMKRLEGSPSRMAVFAIPRSQRGRTDKAFRIVYADTIVSMREIENGRDANGFTYIGTYDSLSSQRTIERSLEGSQWL